MREFKVYKNSEALNKKFYIDWIDDAIGIPKERVYCFFDDQEYMEYDQNIGNCYKKNKGFHRYTGDKERIIGYHPCDIFTIMKRDDCDHFIWISKEICESNDAKFAWYYSHELQHLIHYIENPSLCNLSYFLHDTYSGINGPRWPIEVPIEFDCDLMAKTIVKDIFGMDSKSLNEVIRSVFCQEEYRKFIEIEALMPFDIEKETIRIICDNKNKFKSYTHYIDEYELDIDSICSKYVLNH